MEQKLLAYLKEHETEIFDDLKELVLAEASTSDLKELAETRKVLEGIITRRIGAGITVHKTEGGHDPISFEFGSGEEKVFIIGHYDTVCPIGSMEYRVEGNELHGPGVLDMKSGLISAVWVMKAYKDLGIDPGKKLVMVCNGDEEITSPDSIGIILDQAKGARAALVIEPCCAGSGDLKTGRKGRQCFEVTIHGKAAHSGNNHQGGINAIEEMAHEVLFLQGLTDYDQGTTMNVGVCSGGTKSNVIPDTAAFEVDCRFKKASEIVRIRDLVHKMQVTVPGTTREVKDLPELPAMEQKEENIALYELAAKAGEKLGLKFSHQFVGGGSDGNKVSALGIPTLDGLGAAGDGAHAVNEHILIDQYVPRIAMLATLILDI